LTGAGCAVRTSGGGLSGWSIRCASCDSVEADECIT
jgi:hypothetical protein